MNIPVEEWQWDKEDEEKCPWSKILMQLKRFVSVDEYFYYFDKINLIINRRRPNWKWVSLALALALALFFLHLLPLVKNNEQRVIMRKNSSRCLSIRRRGSRVTWEEWLDQIMIQLRRVDQWILILLKIYLEAWLYCRSRPFVNTRKASHIHQKLLVTNEDYIIPISYWIVFAWLEFYIA